MVLDPMISIQRFYDAENEYFTTAPEQRDITPLLAELDPDVVVEVPDSLPHGGSWRGHAGFENLFQVVAEHWSTFQVVWDRDNFHPIGADRIMCEGVLSAVLRATGRQVTMLAGSRRSTFSQLGVSQLVHDYKDSGAVLVANRSAGARSAAGTPRRMPRDLIPRVQTSVVTRQRRRQRTWRKGEDRMRQVRVGLVVPSSNVTVETELPAILARHPEARFSFIPRECGWPRSRPGGARRHERPAGTVHHRARGRRARSHPLRVPGGDHGSGPGRAPARRRHWCAEQLATGGSAAMIRSSAGALVGLHGLEPSASRLVMPYMRPLAHKWSSTSRPRASRSSTGGRLRWQDNARGRLHPRRRVMEAARIPRPGTRGCAS